MIKIIFLLLISFLFYACSGLGDAGKALRNEKTISTDEFLVKKREPLILPPNYDTVPKPGSISKKKISETDKVKKLLSPSNIEVLNQKNPTSSETSILNKIRK